MNFQVLKLWPLLKSFSLDERINLWTVLVRPLFEMLIFPYHMESSKTNQEKAHVIIRKTFKKFCLLVKNIDDKTVERLMGFDFRHRVKIVVEKTRIKWEARKQNRTPKLSPAGVERSNSNLAYYPSELQVLLNLKTALCPVCSERCNSLHLREVHNIAIPGNSELLDLVEAESVKRRSSKMSRNQNILEVGALLSPYIEALESLLNQSA